MAQEQNRVVGYFLSPLLGGAVAAGVAVAADLHWPLVVLLAVLGAVLGRPVAGVCLLGFQSLLDRRWLRVLDDSLATLRQQPYDWWVSQVGTTTVAHPAGRSCPVDVQAYWNNQPGGSVRVVVSVGSRAISAPLVDGFIVDPEPPTEAA